MIGTCYAMTHRAINTHERKKCEVKQLLLWEKISRPPNKMLGTYYPIRTYAPRKIGTGYHITTHDHDGDVLPHEKCASNYD